MKQIVIDYNHGLLVPELYQMRDKRCERTIRTWIEQYLQSDYNMFALVHSNWNTTRKRKVTEIESQILLGMLPGKHQEILVELEFIFIVKHTTSPMG
ncbi:hypothetical protein MASR1M36_13830 [Candidatus Cloacimonadaceae bacterium]